MNDQAIIVGAGCCRLDDDLVDNRAELHASLGLVDGLGRQRVIEAIDDLSPGLDRTRVKLGNLSGLLERGELALELLALAAGAVERHQPRVGCRRVGSGADAVDELLDLHLRPRQALREVALGVALGLAQARALGVVFGERMAYDLGPQQLALEALEDAPLDVGDRHEEAVPARPALAHGRAAEPVLANDRVTAAAAAAAQQSRQQSRRRYALDSRHTDGRLLASLGARPGLVVDDAQVRRRQGRARLRESPLTSEHETSLASQTNIEKEVGERRELDAALQQLSASQRQVVRLLKLEQLSLKEAAAKTGLSIGALKVASHRALKKLRKVFTSQGNET